MHFDPMSTLSGAGSGAAIGGSVGGAPGAAIGGVIGGIGGFLSGNARHQSAKAQRNATDAAMKRLQMLSQQQYQNRMADLDKALAFYGPAQNALMAYGQPTPELFGPGGAPPPGMGGFNNAGVTKGRTRV